MSASVVRLGACHLVRCAVVLALLSTTRLVGEDLAALTDAAIKRFEELTTREFRLVEDSLERWRTGRLRQSMGELALMLSKATAADQVFIAYHILDANPTNRLARQVFTDQKLAAPFDDKGEPTPGFSMPICENRALVDKVAAMTYPPFDVVREAIDPQKNPSVKNYFSKERDAQRRFQTEMADLAKRGAGSNQADVILPMLAYYDPGSAAVKEYYRGKGKTVPRQRTWFPPLDRWLLNQELAGIDCLDDRVFKPEMGQPPAGGKGQPGTFHGSAAWRFPEFLRNCRMELIATIPPGSQPAFHITDDRQRGVALQVANATTIKLTHLTGGAREPLAEIVSKFPLEGVSLPLQFEVRGNRVFVKLASVLIGEAKLPAEYAYNRVTVHVSQLPATQCRLRFLSDLPVPAADSIAKAPTGPAAPAAPATPASAPWMTERKAQLDKPVTFAFADTSVEEVVAYLSQVTGLAFALDAKAQALKDLPVTLTGKEMRLKTALEWLQRVSDLEAVPSEKGFTFTWKK